MNTRFKHDLHLPTTNLTLAQKDSCTLEAKFLTAYHRLSKLSQKILNIFKLHLSINNLSTPFIFYMDAINLSVLAIRS